MSSIQGVMYFALLILSAAITSRVYGPMPAIAVIVGGLSLLGWWALWKKLDDLFDEIRELIKIIREERGNDADL